MLITHSVGRNLESPIEEALYVYIMKADSGALMIKA
jgi:hypothetical protein